MTRLRQSDICHISAGLGKYNRELLEKTGRTLLGIACHAGGADEKNIQDQMNAFSIHVVPVTAGQGIISDFCETVTAILRFLGFAAARVSDQSDVSGIARAFESQAHAVMMADDNRFVGIHLKKGSVIDNSEATGRVFAAALDLMAKGINGREVLVMGCGPVGEAASRTLLSFGARVGLYDSHPRAAGSLKEKLSRNGAGNETIIEKDITTALSNYAFILEATPSTHTIPDRLIREDMMVAAPGVPLGISDKGCRLLKDRLLHDKLELGVAAMAISLLL